MLNSRWVSPAWMKPEVTMRQTSPCATVARDSAPSRRIALLPSPAAPLPPPKSDASSTITLTTISA